MKKIKMFTMGRRHFFKSKNTICVQCLQLNIDYHTRVM